MPRLIDATKYHDAIALIMQCWSISPCLSDEERTAALSNMRTALQVLSEQPTIDPESLRPHGRWLNKEVDEIRCHVYGNCSVCHERKRIDNYCPNCGAKMDLEEEV